MKSHSIATRENLRLPDGFCKFIRSLFDMSFSDLLLRHYIQ